jgi:hypothetical protein
MLVTGGAELALQSSLNLTTGVMGIGTLSNISLEASGPTQCSRITNATAILITGQLKVECGDITGLPQTPTIISIPTIGSPGEISAAALVVRPSHGLFCSDKSLRMAPNSVLLLRNVDLRASSLLASSVAVIRTGAVLAVSNSSVSIETGILGADNKVNIFSEDSLWKFRFGALYLVGSFGASNSAMTFSSLSVRRFPDLSFRIEIMFLIVLRYCTEFGRCAKRIVCSCEWIGTGC